MNGIYIRKLDGCSDECNYCESHAHILKIEGKAHYREYGSYGEYIEICLECLKKIIRGEMKIVANTIIMPTGEEWEV